MLIAILTQIVTPVFILIGIGVVVNRLMPVDLPTLNKMTFHVFAPAIVFLKLIDTGFDGTTLGLVAGFCLVHLLLLLLVSWKIFALPVFQAHRPVLAMGTIFYNAGNFGFPLAQLAFGDYGVGIMAIILAMQVLTNFTIGIWILDVENGSWKDVLRSFLRVPLVYAILAAVVVNALHLQTPAVLLQPLNYLANGLIPTALLVLGIQLGRSKIIGNLHALGTLIFSRLVVSPLLAVGMIAVLALLLPNQAETIRQIGPVLVIGLGLPVAVNVYVLCADRDRDPELASQSIFWTTLLSAFSVTLWLAILRIS